jgi:hypothetical protein
VRWVLVFAFAWERREGLIRSLIFICVQGRFVLCLSALNFHRETLGGFESGLLSLVSGESSVWLKF